MTWHRRPAEGGVWDHSACLRSRVGLCGGRSSCGGAGGGRATWTTTVSRYRPDRACKCSPRRPQCIANGRTRTVLSWRAMPHITSETLALTRPSTPRAGRGPPAHAQRTSHTPDSVSSVFAPTAVMGGVGAVKGAVSIQVLDSRIPLNLYGGPSDDLILDPAITTGCEPGAGLAFALGPGGQVRDHVEREDNRM
jgi:hypothetical protein